MPVRNRNTLKNFFRNGKSPSENEFSDLIDSTWNKVDDGLNRTEADGLKLTPIGNATTLVSLYDKITAVEPRWQIAINPDQNKGLFFQQSGGMAATMMFSDEGNIGVKTSQPRAELDISGNVCATGRMGGYKIGYAPANGQWHTIVSNLAGFNAFEIMAAAEGNKGEGNYVMAHAIALNACQGASGKIRIISTSYGWFDFRDKIFFRWRGTPENYNLQIRTGKHYFLNAQKKSHPIRFHITRLWDHSVMQTLTKEHG